nr:MAG TPA: hypothetical protein [Caudoviricetes sp.]DAY19528.1 MAG TPA: hypothetical protein [Caudoviricetes sp.]
MCLKKNKYRVSPNLRSANYTLPYSRANDSPPLNY